MRIGVLISLGGSAVLGVGALLVANLSAPAAVTPPSSTAAPERGSAPVVVAASALAYGVKLEAKHLKVVRFPNDAVPVGAFSTVDQLLAQSQGAPVVLTAIAEREPLLPAKLSGLGARPSVAAGIAEGKRGYAIRVTDVTGVGGHALPGDHVDVVLTRDLPEDMRNRRAVSEVVVQNVRLLGVDLNADQASIKAEIPNTATLEVTVEEAQRLAVAAQAGTLSLALRGSGAAEVEIVRSISVNDLETGRPTSAAPASTVVRNRRPAAPRAPAPNGLIIVQGDQSSRVSVPSDRGPGA
jgi:pilus assembly protein CpaB